MSSSEHGPERTGLTDFTVAELTTQVAGDTVQSIADELSPGEISNMIAAARENIAQRVTARGLLNEEITAHTMNLTNLLAALSLANDKNPGV